MNAVRRIKMGEAEIYKRLRLAALKDSPEAFSTTYESALARTAASWSAQVEEAAQGNDRGIFLAFCDHEAVGMAALYRDGDHPQTGEILQMWIASPYRSQGIGKQLLDTIVDWARACRFEELKAQVTGLNQRAIPFYENYGFKHSPVLHSLPQHQVTLLLAI
jgi:GNAT superfamily N-acetyltransferase